MLLLKNITNITSDKNVSNVTLNKRVYRPIPTDADCRRLCDEFCGSELESRARHIHPSLHPHTLRCLEYISETIQGRKEGKEMVYLTVHSKHFIYGFFLIMSSNKV